MVIHWTVKAWALSILLSPRPSNSLVTLTTADLLVSLFMILSPFLLNPSYWNHMVPCPKHCDAIRKCVVRQDVQTHILFYDWDGARG